MNSSLHLVKHMQKIVILLDEWIADKNFILSELELIKKQYDTTVVCNDFSRKEEYPLPGGVRFLFYSRPNKLKAASALFKSIFNRATLREIKHLKSENNKLSKLSEIIRFYCNSELFFNFLKANNLISNENIIFYSYWYFWKCFAITNHKKDYPNIKIVSRTHEYDLYTVSIPSGYQPFKYEMDKNLDKLVFIAEHGMDYYLKRYGFEMSDKYCLYHLGTKDYGLSPYTESDTVNVVSCSSVIPRKRVEKIVEALSIIDNVKINWIHFGTGDSFESLKALATEKLSSKENISYCLKGYTKHEEIMEYYKTNSVDAFIMAAVSEGNPVSVIEAMSFGIPVISANICNMPYLVNGNGYLVSKNIMADELSDAIINLSVLESENRNSLRNMSRKLWEENYREEINNQRFLLEVLGKL